MLDEIMSQKHGTAVSHTNKSNRMNRREQNEKKESAPPMNETLDKKMRKVKLRITESRWSAEKNKEVKWSTEKERGREKAMLDGTRNFKTPLIDFNKNWVVLGSSSSDLTPRQIGLRRVLNVSKQFKT